MRDFAAILIAASMLPAQTPVSTVMKQRVSLIPSGTAVEVRTVDKKKLRGRIGVVNDTGFAFQRSEGTRLIDDRVPFDRVQSVKELRRDSPGFGRLVLGFLAAIGGISLISLLALALGD